jgi:hypothetical protein
MTMPSMLAYTIVGSFTQGAVPQIVVGQGPTRKYLKPDAPLDDSYWWCILDANNPANKVKEFVVPGSSNTLVPGGLDAYLSNPAYIFACVTQYLSTLHVPQGALYNYFVAHGAGRELQALEQINTSLGCGSYTRVSYVLTAQGGSGNGYEFGSYRNYVNLLMSFMPQANGAPPYALCDCYTFLTGN